jgi:O-antigen/teichoic acid export membrane protein
MNSKLSHSFTWILAGNSAMAACQWGVVALLARFSSHEILGAYAVGLSVSSVVFGLTGLELRTLQVTDHSQRTSFSTYCLLRLTTGLSSLAALCIATIFLHYSTATRFAIVLVALGKCLDGISDVIYGRLQACDRMPVIGKSLIAKAGLSIALPAVCLFLRPQSIAAVAATVVPYAAVLFLYDVPNLRTLSRRWPLIPVSLMMRSTAALARTGLPLTIVATLVALHTAIPRLVLASRLGESQAGIFTALSYLAIAPNLLLVALGQASIAPLSRSLVQGDEARYRAGVARMFGAAAAAGTITLATGFWSGGAILSMFYGPRFSEYTSELMILLGAGAVSYLNTAAGYGLASARIFSRQIPMMAVVSTVSLIASWTLVGRWGVAGAAASLIISTAVQLAWATVLLGRTAHRRTVRSSAQWAAVVAQGVVSPSKP